MAWHEIWDTEKSEIGLALRNHYLYQQYQYGHSISPPILANDMISSLDSQYVRMRHTLVQRPPNAMLMLDTYVPKLQSEPLYAISTGV